ncbi:MAG TPA: hypothetical protein VFO66_13925 [Gemmatimonadaceae bacterium]|nr:hypothetical protein [Gemmatimonadaceae bacterium]
MATRRYLPALLVALAACAQRPAETTPQPLIPKNGPEANVRVEYEGGIFNRRLQALFSVKRPAYVMVAHLGGDGVIRVLFPEDARESGWVEGGKLFRTDVTTGDYDAAPGYWFMRPAFFRSMGARTDSYDGNGHGFVFMIASATPLRFDRVSEFGLWNEVELRSYATTSDPRGLIRNYAYLLAPNGKFTLDYASSYSSWASYSYANARMDCAMLSGTFGYSPWYFSPYSFGYFPSFGYMGYHGFGRSRCGDDYYFDRYRRLALANWNGAPVTPVTTSPSPAPETPVANPKPIDPRSGRRDPLRPSRDGGTRTLTYTTPSGRRFDPDRRTTTSGGERVYPAPSTWQRGPYGSWNSSPFGSPRDGGYSGGRPSDPRAGSTGGAGSSSIPSPSTSAPASTGSRAADTRPGAAEMKNKDP